MALTEKLNAIGDAIRAKTGGSEKLTLDQMPTEIASISSGGGAEVEPTVLTGSTSYVCSGSVAAAYIKLYGNTITTKDISSSTDNMFYNSTLEYIPFDINCSNSSEIQLQNTFYYAKNLKEVPYVYNPKPRQMNGLFGYCHNLREIPEDYFDTWDFNTLYMANSTSGYNGRAEGVFNSCYSLRKTPLGWVKYMNPVSSYSYAAYYNMFSGCYSLDEIVDLPIPYINPNWTGSVLSTLPYRCFRLKRFTFETNKDGTPLVVQWKSQTLDLGEFIGYADSITYILNYNSGITADKEVSGIEQYQALKNDPDWFTRNQVYSRYNHDSAVETINSLPDTSAYLATAGGTNTIKFRGVCGSGTDGGAINTLTEEEIAVAAAKGWTVTFI